jgi:O-antigen ligase
LYYFVIKMADTERHFYFIYWMIILGTCFNGAESIINYFMGHAHYNQGVMRAAGTTSFGYHPNSMAMYMATTIPMLMYLFSRHKARLTRLFAVVLICMCLFCLMITGSRSGVLTIMGVAITLAWFTRHRLIYFAAMAILAIGIWVALPEQYKARYGTITDEQVDASSQGRLDAWKAGLGMFMEKPIYGVGPGAFAAAYMERDGIWLYSHSLYIEIIASTGLLGLITWCFFMYQFFRWLSRMKRQRDTAEYKKNKISVFIHSNYAIIAGLLVAGVFGHILFRDTFYVMAGIIVAARHTLIPEPEPTAEAT